MRMPPFAERSPMTPGYGLKKHQNDCPPALCVRGEATPRAVLGQQRNEWRAACQYLSRCQAAMDRTRRLAWLQLPRVRQVASLRACYCNLYSSYGG